jgi:hypothetical protein
MADIAQYAAKRKAFGVISDDIILMFFSGANVL